MATLRRIYGGPLDGKEIECEATKGFVYWDLDFDKVVVYNRDTDRNFVAAGDEQDLDEVKLGKAQEDEGRKIMAFGTFPFSQNTDIEEVEEVVFDLPDDEVDSDA